MEYKEIKAILLTQWDKDSNEGSLEDYKHDSKNRFIGNVNKVNLNG